MQAADIGHDGECVGRPPGQVLALHAPRQDGLPPHAATLERVLRLRLALVAAVLVVAVGIALVLRPDGGDENVPVIPTPPGATRGEPVADPFAWTEERSADLAKRATAGTSHLLYTRSPGGVAVTAERVARYRPQVERAAKAAGVDPDRLEALVFLESAGRPEARAPGGIEGAAGLTQILAETATSLLEMQVDVERSGELHAPDGPGAAAGQRAPRRGAQPGAPARGRPLRPREGAGRDRALPEAGNGALPARGLRVRLLPHGHGQPRDRDRGLRRAPRLLRGALLRLHAVRPRARLPAARLLRRRLLELLLEARRRAGDHAARPAATRPGWRARPRCRPPTTPPAGCCSPDAPEGDLRTLPEDPVDTALRASPGIQLRPEAAARGALRRGSGAHDLRRGRACA